MSMNTIIQINSYFDMLIYAQRSLYVKRYSSCIHNFRITYYFIFRHFMTRRLFDIFLHYTTAFVSTRFWLISTSCLYLSNVFNVEHEAHVYMYRHYLTSFDIIWHNLISFFIYFCQCLSNVFNAVRGRSDVEYRSNLSEPRVCFIFRLNSTKFAGATTQKNLWRNFLNSRQIKRGDIFP